MTRKFTIIKGGKQERKSLSLDEFEKLSEKDRKEYLKPARDNGIRLDLITKILRFFEFEVKDNMIDISFLYNLDDKDLMILYSLLYGNGGKNGKI